MDMFFEIFTLYSHLNYHEEIESKIPNKLSANKKKNNIKDKKNNIIELVNPIN